MPYNFVKAQVAPEPIDASNPASGVNNIQMQGGIDAGGAIGSATPAAASSGGVSAQEAKRILNQVASAGFKAIEHKGMVEDLYNRLTDENIQGKVAKLLQALEKNNDPRTQTRDPQTGFKDPTASQMAQQIITEITQMERENKIQEQQKAATFNSYNLRIAAGKKKKRDSRGNPFKVLMGKVGKLLDHGISKKDIVRFLIKEGNWNEETVEKAVNLVRDYNKKKHRGDKKLKDAEENKEASNSSDETLKLGAKTDNDPCWDGYEMVGMKDKDGKSVPNCVPKSKKEKEASSGFNFKKYAQTSLELDGVYGIQPEWSKRSTAELIMRATWLISLQNYDEKTPQGDGKKASNKKGVTAQLKDIKKALNSRGFDGEELFENLQRKF